MSSAGPRHAVSGTAALALSGIGIRFTAATGAIVTVVDDLDLTLAAGEMFCIVGRSGSGKTSILRVAAAITRPTAGDIAWWGTDLASLNEPEIRDLRRTRIGYLDQASVMVPDLDSLENVLVPVLPDGRKLVRRRRSAAEDLLDRLGLGSRIHHLPQHLSGGERQRVALARAMINEPDLLIVDEPTASLDRHTADDVIGLLADYAGAHAVLVASHDPHVAEAATASHALDG